MGIEREVEPGELGFDAARLARIDKHFGQYVDDGRLAGWQIVVAREGKVVHASTYGQRDREAGLPVEPDTLWRIYSMTKPLTSVAAMMLWEEGRFELNDPISKWLPEFTDMRVYVKGAAAAPFTVPAIEPIRVWHLLTHTSGLTYGFMNTSVVAAIYRQRKLDVVPGDGLALRAVCAGLATAPLLFQPGSRFGYSMATDVLGRLIEVVAGLPFQDFLNERVLAPLGMHETRWWVDGDDTHRLAALYTPDPAGGPALRFDAMGAGATRKPVFHSGGGGLISTAADYHRFNRFMLGRGELDGVRLLGTRTIAYMTRNHLPGGQDLATLNSGGFAESVLDGIGFGLGFAVVQNPIPIRVPSSPGEYYWGGLASTAFFVDPVERITALLFTQLVPSSTYPLRPQLRQLIYSALVD